MKSKIKRSEPQSYPIKVIIKLESKEEVMKFLAANSYATYQNTDNFSDDILPYMNRDDCMKTLENILDSTNWVDLKNMVRDEV